MWTDYRRAPNLMIAEMWKNVLEGEGLPTKIIPEGDITEWGERVPFRIHGAQGPRARGRRDPSQTMTLPGESAS